jgi:Tol biopolymer transport system component
MKNMGVGPMRAAGAVILAVILLVGTGKSQDEVFGKNKVQYKNFHWSFIQSDHFDVYFSDGGYYLAQFTAVAAESAYASMAKLFRYQLINRVPLVIYNSHNDFQQTNVVTEYLEEGIGGVTELFKNRVVLPFEGDYRKFRHVIHHELVHAVVNDMFYGGSIQSILSNNITLQLPLWLNEGLAEYAALRWDTNSDMYMRDATVHENLVPIPQLYGYFAYRGGQSVWWYISNKYGEQKVGDILNRIKSTRSVEGGFRGAIGLGIEELSERWQKDLKVNYWPDIAKREDPGDYARRLTDRRKDGSFYNTSPAISPAGDKIAFISNRNDYFDVFIMNAADGTNVDKLLDGQTTSNLEELHLLTPGMSWSPDGKRLVLATKAGEQDALFVIDIDSGRQDKITFDLDGIFSVVWSPVGDKLAFVGNKDQQSDIYLYDLQAKVLVNLTDDIYSDAAPAWSPDGKFLVFSSDRGNPLKTGGSDPRHIQFSQADLYQLDLQTKELTRLTDWPGSDQISPVVGSTGKTILFVSDRNGINNIYSMDLTNKSWRPVTNSLTGIFQISLSKDGSKLAFTSLNHGGYDIFLLRNPFERDVKVAELEPSNFFKALPSKIAPKTRVASTDSGASIASGTVPPVVDSVKTITPIAATAADTVHARPALAVKDTTGGKAPPDTAGLYGKDIQIDFSNYVFKDTYNDALPRDSLIEKLPKITNNLDESGNYKVNKYKLNFTPDIIYGNAGYDTFYGVTGSTIMAFSDLLGDHQIVFSTNLMLDLKNSDYGLQYFYLPNRLDLGFGGFHSARFVIINDQFGGSLYRFRTYGANVAAVYPLSKFNRLEGGLNWFNISKENLDYSDQPIQLRTVLVPQLSYVYDTILWGFTAPVNGTRYRFNIFGTPKLGSSGLEFVNLTGDYRTYLRLGRNYSIALRLAGGGSFGRNPQKFIVGGVSNWINRQFEGGYVPLENAEDFIFLQVGVPLRGYNYNAAIGSRYGLFNFEFRYPLFAFLQAGPLPIGLQSLAGAMFFDMGSAWNRERDFKAFTKDENGNTVARDLLMGMGTGARVFFLAFLFKFDVAWAWNGNSFSPPKYYFSLGEDF